MTLRETFKNFGLDKKANHCGNPASLTQYIYIVSVQMRIKKVLFCLFRSLG